jgi:hypothetical protein
MIKDFKKISKILYAYRLQKNKKYYVPENNSYYETIHNKPYHDVSKFLVFGIDEGKEYIINKVQFTKVHRFDNTYWVFHSRILRVEKKLISLLYTQSNE